MHIKMLKAAFAGLVLSVSSFANAGLIFTFSESGGDVLMTSSGSIDTSGLVSTSTSGWVGTGIEENGNHDIMGGTAFGSIDSSFGFNTGTDYSQWVSGVGPWTSSFFGFSIEGGSKSFTTYFWDGVQTPGLGINSADLIGSIWSADQNWKASNQTFASIGLNVGTYSVVDSVSGEFITFQIGEKVQVPEPSTLAIFVLGVMGLASRGFKKQ